MNKHVERVLQLSIILACFIVLTARWIATSSTAQTLQCNGEPTIKTNTHSNPYFWLKANSWLPGTSAISKRQINVVIYDTPPDHAAQMNEGIQLWNSKSDCAYVNFNTATQATGPPGVQPPNTLWVI